MRRVLGALLLVIVVGGGRMVTRVPLGTPPEPRPTLPSDGGERLRGSAGADAAPQRTRGAVPDAFARDPLAFLSTAGADSLILLPGIGPVLAGRIVDHRDRRGPFYSWTDVDRVTGIGPRTIDRLRRAAGRSQG